MAAAPNLELESYVIDQVRCPECALTCLQKNIYRHMLQIHQWSTNECKTLVSAIRKEKKKRESATSFVCSFCRVLFRSVKHLMQHKRICAAQPDLMPGDDADEIEDMFMDEMIVEGEEVIGMENYNMEHVNEKPSTSSGRPSSYDVVPPHRQNSHQGSGHHLLEELIPAEGPEDQRDARDPKDHRDQRKPVKFTCNPPSPVPPPINSSSIKYNPAVMNRHRGSHLKCPECQLAVESIEEFLNHCKTKHETKERKFTIEKPYFHSKDEFKKWFDQRQEDTCTSLTKRTGHGGETLYRCHRVGKYRSVAKSRKSNPRKVDQACTAYLKVKLQDDILWATGCFTHIGHDLDHKLLWLTETQEGYVRELIDMNWNSDQIFYFIRNEYKDYECKLKYITKNDIRNITVRYNREKVKMGFLPNSKSLDDPDSLQEAKEELIEEEVVEEEDDEPKEKIPLLEGEEAEDVATEKPPEADAPKEDPEQPVPIVTYPEEDGDVEVDPESVEEEEYINVVDDDSMPELEKVAEV